MSSDFEHFQGDDDRNGDLSYISVPKSVLKNLVEYAGHQI